jgi:hypothetical protein
MTEKWNYPAYSHPHWRWELAGIYMGLLAEIAIYSFLHMVSPHELIGLPHSMVTEYQRQSPNRAKQNAWPFIWSTFESHIASLLAYSIDQGNHKDPPRLKNYLMTGMSQSYRKRMCNGRELSKSLENTVCNICLVIADK